MMGTLKRDIASRRKEATITVEAQQIEAHDACPLCGGRARSSRPSIREMLLNTVCAGILVAILIPAFWLSEQWLERAGQRAVDHMFWREPIESWSR